MRIAVTGASGPSQRAVRGFQHPATVSRVGRQADPNRGGVRWDPQRGRSTPRRSKVATRSSIWPVRASHRDAGRQRTKRHPHQPRQSTQPLRRSPTYKRLQLHCCALPPPVGTASGCDASHENSPPGTGFLPEVCRGGSRRRTGAAPASACTCATGWCSIPGRLVTACGRRRAGVWRHRLRSHRQYIP